MDPDDLYHNEPKLDPSSLKLLRDEAGGLQAIGGDGRHFDGLTPIRLFPLSDPEHWIALVDSHGREVAILPAIEALDQRSASILNEELTTREFVPHIQRILWISGNSEPSQWRVATDRGTTEFVLNDEKDIRRLGKNGILIIDAHGIRYLIDDDRKLDRYSRRIVEWYVT